MVGIIRIGDQGELPQHGVINLHRNGSPITDELVNRAITCYLTTVTQRQAEELSAASA